MKYAKIIYFLVTFILIIFSFLAGLYFKNDVQKLFDKPSEVKNTDKASVGYLSKVPEKIIISPPPLNVSAKPRTTQQPAEVTLDKNKIIDETNLQRKANGNLPAVKENSNLDSAALAKAKDMFSHQYFEHVSPSGINPGKLVQLYGYDYVVTGENLILGNFSGEKEVVQKWMDSIGHRANILNKRYTEIGVAAVKGTYKGGSVWIGVQEFGLPITGCAKPDDGLKNTIDKNNMQIDSMYYKISQEKSQISNLDPNSENYQQLINDYNKLVENYNAFIQQTKDFAARYNDEISIFNNCINAK